MAGSRKLEVVIAGDARGAINAFGDVDNRSGRLGRTVGNLGPMVATGIGAIAAGVGAAGVALFEVGSQFDSAFDTIRIQTGATGNELAGLEEDFRGVVRNVPSSFADASTAIAGLNARLGLSGPALRNVAAPILNLTRMTGGDLPTNIQTMTRVFGDWDIGARQMPETLDQIFRASQATGTGVDALSANVVQFGAPLRAMGFSLEDSLALFGQFEAEGVNISTVLGGMRRGLAGFAADGEAPAEALRRMQEEIKNAGSVAEANSIAIEVFGSRAGPDMAAAIREGRFEVDALTDTIVNGRDSIASAAGDTADFGEQWQLIKNRVFLALEPIAARVFQGIGDAMTALGPVVGQVGEWLGARLPAAVAAVEDAVESLRPVWDQVLATVREVWPEVSRVISEAATTIQQIIGAVIDVVSVIWSAFGDDILRVIRTVFPPILQTIRGTLQIIRGVIQTITSIIRGDWSGAWNGIKMILAGVWNFIVGRVRLAIVAVRTVISIGLQVIQNLWGVVWRNISALFRGVWSAITGTVRAAVSIVRSIISAAWNAVRSTTVSVWNGIKSAVRSGVSAVIGFVQSIPGRVASIARGAFDALVDGFRNAVNAIIGMWNGLGIHFPGFDIPGPGPNVPSFDFDFPNLPTLATGGTATRGGLAVVGEQGAEIVRLPTGSSVHPNGTSLGGEVHIHLHGPVFGADDAAVERMLVAALRSAQRKGLTFGLAV
jgi:phage-related protein